MVPRQHKQQRYSQRWVGFSVSGALALSFLPYRAAPVSAWSPSQQVLAVGLYPFAGFWCGFLVRFLQTLSILAQSLNSTPLPSSADIGL